ncbi:FKBP-type peptidyl-prolyl cis-trans isomerase [Tautonia plasticadhaerens]|uniref:Peptidyl-prolyl cis-trans isomerase n=1 Tax=Tautonia plasticadhaerens TaxID=2527974 RepID=A0A518H866_9BACT|nr:FKBP-type peptidyl-prolyl cis-trans isomerase [Tautonia plasticadhaerens]QDV37052.1 Outer membrane protein MIP precursor [Tautonia plasticadhaerens]
MSDLMVMALGALLVASPAAARAQDQPAPKQAQASQGDPSPLPDLNSKASYGFGLNIGRTLKTQADQFRLDATLVARGIADGLTDSQPLLTEEQCNQVMEEFEKQLLARQMEAEKEMLEANKEQAASNKAAGEAYLAENGKKPGVKMLSSGIQYEPMKAGQGATPTLTDTVTINYKGTLLDGTVFDSTDGKGPMTFPVGEFIEGWKQSLQLMKVGDKWRVVIPPELAYGESGTPGGPIPPNATLIFEIELLGIAGK